MIIYNVTTKVHHSVSEEWLQWTKEIHIPEILETGLFTDAKVVRLLEIDDSEGPTYAVQYTAESKAMYNAYIEKFSQQLRQKAFDKWGDKFIAFRSLMQIVE